MYALAVLAVALVFGTSHATTADDAMAQALRRAKSLHCTWTQGTGASWDRYRDTWSNYIRSLLGLRRSIEPVVTQVDDAPFSTQFDMIDWPSATAKIRFQDAEPHTVSLSTNMGSITFIETTLADILADRVSVTTVFVLPIESGANTYPAVMSRHLAGMGMDVAGQYYGTCSVVS